MSRLNETRTMNCGLQAKIIAYRSATDIDVIFENGLVSYHKRYDHFKNGNIANPETTSSAKKHSRIGMSRKMNCGMNATIVAYFSWDNITIQFEDGTIVEKVHFSKFKNGTIQNPNLKRNNYSHYLNSSLQSERIGEQNTANNGQVMTLIDYKTCRDITIQFEDGTIVNTNYAQFKRGTVLNPNRLYNTGISYNEIACLSLLSKYGFHKGAKGSLKKYGLGNKELDMFCDSIPNVLIGIEYDGYSCGEKGHTIHKDMDKDKICADNGIVLYRIREPQLEQYHSSSLIYYLDSRNRLSDSLLKVLRTIVEDINDKYNQNFVFSCTNEDIQMINETYDKIFSFYKDKWQNTTRKMKNGLIAKIVSYRAYNDIDVKFEDGTIVYNKGVKEFLKGLIKHPNVSTQNVQARNRHIGEKYQLISRECVEIIDWISSTDVTVRHDDGTISYHAIMGNIKRGYVKKNEKRLTKDYTGESRVMNNSMMATIIRSSGSKSNDIQFEDGAIVYNRQYGSFARGTVKHPLGKRRQ